MAPPTFQVLASSTQRNWVARMVLVVPALNEAELLPHLVDSIARQVDGHGARLPECAVVLVDNGSTDRTLEVGLAALDDARIGEWAIVRSNGGIVAARSAGFAFALDRTAVVQAVGSVDADVELHRMWAWSALGAIAAGDDAVSALGSFGAEFWRATPALRRRYAESIGDVFFDAETRQLEPSRNDLNVDIFSRMGRVLCDQCFAVRPDAYRHVGGYAVIHDADGNEILHEGGRLTFALCQQGFSIATDLHAPYITSPRRLVGEAARLFTGESYSGPRMEAFRQCSSADIARLDHGAHTLDYSALRRYVLANYVVFPAVCDPTRAPFLDAYLGCQAVWVANEIARFQPADDGGVGAVELTQRLAELLNVGRGRVTKRLDGGRPPP